jgi:hypothetical protein
MLTKKDKAVKAVAIAMVLAVLGSVVVKIMFL